MAGKIQNEDIKSLAELTSAGGSASQLINDTKIYLTAGGLNKQLSAAISDGSIGGGGSTNLITDGNAEGGTTNYIEGSYSAAARPSGTFTPSSGAGAFAISTTTTNPISGTTTFLLTKSSGASRQGRAVTRAISIDSEYQTKCLETFIKVRVVSGSFVAGSDGSSSTDSSLIWYAEQYNGSTWVQSEPSRFKMYSSSTTIVEYVQGNFQINSDTTQIRIVAYVAETANSAWVVQCEWGVRPCNYVYGANETSWVNYIPNGGWSNCTYTGRWRKIGDSIEVFAQATLTGTPSGTLSFSLPNNLQIDNSKLLANGAGLGHGTWFDSASTGIMGVLCNYGNSTSINPFGQRFSSSGNHDYLSFSPTGLKNFTTNDWVNVYFRAPIVGWETTTQVSDGYDGRQIVANAQNNANVSVSNGVTTKMTFGSKVYDTTNSFNTSTSTFTAPSSGYYRVESVIGYPGTSGTGSRVNLIYKNGSNYSQVGIPPVTDGGATQVFNSAEMYLNAGDTIEIYALQTGGGSMTLNGSNNQVHISKLQSPQTMSATEVVAARYTTAAGQSIPNTTTAIIDFGTKDFDTHNAVTTGASWKFTAPIAGLYSVKALVRYANSLSWTSGSYVAVHLYKNGSVFSLHDTLMQATITPAQGPATPIIDTVQLNSGDYIDIRTSHGESSARALVATGLLVRVEIERIK